MFDKIFFTLFAWVLLCVFACLSGQAGVKKIDVLLSARWGNFKQLFPNLSLAGTACTDNFSGKQSACTIRFTVGWGLLRQAKQGLQ